MKVSQAKRLKKCARKVSGHNTLLESLKAGFLGLRLMRYSLIQPGSANEGETSGVVWGVLCRA